MLQWDGVDSQVSALFYRAVIQAVLMFGSESWTLSDVMIREVEGSHICRF